MERGRRCRSRWNSVTPSDVSSCLMRVVTPDGTRCSLRAAFVTPPSSTTLLNTLRSTKSMGKSVLFMRTTYSLIFVFAECLIGLFSSDEQQICRAFRNCRGNRGLTCTRQRNGDRPFFTDADSALDAA